MKYKLKEGVSWDSLAHQMGCLQDIDFGDWFEEVPELPKVELREQTTDDFIIYEGFYYPEEADKGVYDITKKLPNGLTISIEIGAKEHIKTVAEFNEKCSQLFGFELVEVE